MLTNQRNLQSQKELRQSLRNNSTPAEACLWRTLKGKQIDGLKFRRQFGFGPYILDFYCPEIRLCIELDGEVHKSAEAAEFDEQRTEFLRHNNVEVIRFDNEVVFYNTQGIIEEIQRFHKQWMEKRGNVGGDDYSSPIKEQQNCPSSPPE